MDKKKILFINSVCGYGSTGKIVADLANCEEYETLICYGRKQNLSKNTNVYKIDNKFSTMISMFRTIFFDNNLNLCTYNTKKMINKVKEFKPDLIHLHNLHGYYINIEILFEFLYEYNVPVIWTFHDCWPFTGYCCHYDYLGCNKYQKNCKNCQHGFSYPFSLGKQNIEKDFLKKNILFNKIKDLTIVTPSNWLAKEIKKSFLKEKNILVINNGVTLDERKIEKNNFDNKTKVLAIASIWTKEKGIEDLINISKSVKSNIEFTIVGSIDNKYKKLLSTNCKIVNRTNDREELIKIYCENDVFINPTLQDTYPTVNIEAISFGLPIITYNTGGSVEVVNSKTGIIIEKGDCYKMANAINEFSKNSMFDKQQIINESKKYSKEKMILKYRKLYNEKLGE